MSGTIYRKKLTEDENRLKHAHKRTGDMSAIYFR